MKPIGRKLGLVAVPLLLFAGIGQTAMSQNTCIQDKYTEGGGAGTLQCTAEDVRLSTLIVLNDVVECLEGQTFQLETRAEFIAGAAERYDIGVYIALDGGNARTGLCARDFFFPIDPDPNNWDVGDANNGGTVFPNLEFDDDPDDVCGDIQQGVETYRDLTPLEVTCQDSDSDGFLDLGTCLSWDNNARETCTGLEGVVPGTPAKCNCENVNLPITVLKTAQIEVVKSIDPVDDDGTFNLQIDGVTEFEDAGDGDTTGPVVVTAGTQLDPGDTHTVGEVMGSNSPVILAGYNSLIECVDDGLATFDGGAPLTFDGTGPLDVPVDPDDDIVCTITNTRLTISPVLEVATARTDTYEWTIEKTVDPAEHDLFAGESASSDYDITVTNTGVTPGGFQISGTVSITNPHLVDATIETLTVDIDGVGVAASLACAPMLPATIGNGESIDCTFLESVPDDANRAVTASITTSGAIAAGPDDSEDAVFNGDTQVVDVNNPVNVTDNFMDMGAEDLGQAAAADSPVLFELSREFECSSDPADYDDNGELSFTKDNVATIVETDQTDEASVTVNCYAPVVTKDATTTFRRTWTWTIEKTGDDTELSLSEGQIFNETYWVDVDATSADDQFAASGTITVVNNHPTEVMTIDLSDALDGVAATLDCGGTLDVPAGGEATCDYSADLTDGTQLVNTATATLNGIDFTGTADVVFDLDAPTSEVDECIEVDDDLFGLLGSVCANVTPASFHYQKEIGPYFVPEDCPEIIVTNTATFTTNDTATTGDDDHTITVTLAGCDAEGCTLTQGYWKTHNESFWGGAPPDETWLEILPDAENTTFFLSGQTYFQVMWTPPAGGNAYYQLAHQYIAAVLNVLNGADPTDAVGLIAAAEVILNSQTPAQVGALKGKARQPIVKLAGQLAAYNEGETGPGHCDEEEEGFDFKAGVVLKTADKESGARKDQGLVDAGDEGAVTSQGETDAASGAAGVEEDAVEIPTEFAVSNYPNPFNPSTTLRIELPATEQVSIAVFDMLGRHVATLWTGELQAGVHEVNWNAGNVPSGTYLYSIKAGEYVSSGRMLLIR